MSRRGCGSALEHLLAPRSHNYSGIPVVVAKNDGYVFDFPAFFAHKRRHSYVSWVAMSLRVLFRNQLF